MMNQDTQNVRINSERKQRMLFGAFSGFIAGTVAAIAASFINIWLFPDLPLYLNWLSIFYQWILWAVLCSVLAGIAGLSAEGWKSILLSAVCIAFTILLFSFFQSSESLMLKIVAFGGLLFPIAASMTPLAWVFFWLTKRFIQAETVKGWARIKILLVNFLVIFIIGILPGFYVKMNHTAEMGVRSIHKMLQEASQAPSANGIHKALLKTEGFAEYKNQTYTLSQSPSIYSTVGVDVTAHYADGYTVLCTVVLYPGSDPSIFPCKGQMP